MTRQRAEKQPRDGDVVIVCQHFSDSAKMHYWKRESGINFSRPDGSSGWAKWFACCGGCFVMSGGDPTKITTAQIVTWSGDAPLIYEENT